MLVEQLENIHLMVFSHEIIKTIKRRIIFLFNIIMERFHPIFHVIGDSHAHTFVGQKFFITHTLGPATAYKLRYRNNSTHSKEKLFGLVSRLNKRAIILMILGEIDCRMHIYNQYKQNNEIISIPELVQATVENYCLALQQLKRINKKILVLSIPPAGYQPNVYHITNYGSQQIRSEIHRIFNDLLQETCKRFGLKFVSIYNYVADDKGLMRKEYAADSVHLNQM